MSKSVVVIYAEDDEIVRAVIVDALKNAGVDVRECSSGGEAVRLCIELQPDAVLLDINMPGMDGFQTARELRRPGSRCRHSRIVALTGRCDDEARRNAIAAGFDDFLCKPISAPALLRGLGIVA